MPLREQLAVSPSLALMLRKSPSECNLSESREEEAELLQMAGKAGELRCVTEYLGQNKKKKKKEEIKIETQTIDFPPTFSTAFPLDELSAPCYYECVALAWRWAWQGTRLLSASTGKLKPPPLDTISHGSC